jgi:hypothetical protein
MSWSTWGKLALPAAVAGVVLLIAGRRRSRVWHSLQGTVSGP